MKFSREIKDPIQLHSLFEQYNGDLLDISASQDIDAFERYIINSDIESCLDRPLYQASIYASRMTESSVCYNGSYADYSVRNLPEDNLFSQSPLKTEIDHFQTDMDRIYFITLKDYMKRNLNKDEYENYDFSDKRFTPDKKNKVINSRREKITKYTEAMNDFLYLDIYRLPEKFNARNSADNLKEMQTTIIKRVSEIIRLRERFQMTLNFKLLDADSETSAKKLNESLATEDLNLKEKLDLLDKALDNIFIKMLEANQTLLNFRDYYVIDGDTSIFFRNYLEGKSIPRKSYDKWKNLHIIKDKLFYYEMILFLGLPTSDLAVRFLKQIGIGVDILHPIHNIGSHNIFETDILRWLDCGVNTNIINTLFGFELQRKVPSRVKL